MDAKPLPGPIESCHAYHFNQSTLHRKQSITWLFPRASCSCAEIIASSACAPLSWWLQGRAEPSYSQAASYESDRGLNSGIGNDILSANSILRLIKYKFSTFFDKGCAGEESNSPKSWNTHILYSYSFKRNMTLILQFETPTLLIWEHIYIH